MGVREKVSHVLVCPSCKGDMGSIDHLSEGSWFGPWYCDECGSGWSGRVSGCDVVDLRCADKRLWYTLILLRHDDIYLVVEGIDGDHLEFFYNEHTCPTNYLRCVAVVQRNDTDPHGVFEYVRKLNRAYPKNQLRELLEVHKQELIEELLYG